MDLMAIVADLRSQVADLRMQLQSVPIVPSGDLLIPVIMEQDGGADGDDTVIATWTYTVTTMEGGPLFTALDILVNTTPTYVDAHKFRRPVLGSITPATYGLMYLTRDADPKYGLLWMNEVAVVEAC